jgi:hypothetical protein
MQPAPIGANLDAAPNNRWNVKSETNPAGATHQLLKCCSPKVDGGDQVCGEGGSSIGRWACAAADLMIIDEAARVEDD